MSTENPIQTLNQQTSGARPIPSWEEFEAGTAQKSTTSNVSALESSFGKFEGKDKLTEENVAVALTFLNCDVGSTNADEVEAVCRLLDLEDVNREELERYLRTKSTVEHDFSFHSIT